MVQGDTGKSGIERGFAAIIMVNNVFLGPTHNLITNWGFTMDYFANARIRQFLFEFLNNLGSLTFGRICN